METVSMYNPEPLAGRGSDPGNRGVGLMRGLDGQKLARSSDGARAHAAEHGVELCSAVAQADDVGSHEHLAADHDAREEQ